MYQVPYLLIRNHLYFVDLGWWIQQKRVGGKKIAKNILIFYYISGGRRQKSKSLKHDDINLIYG
jgi:hypothetical protein